MKYHVLYNTMAGHGDAKQKANELSAALEGEVCLCDISTISYPEFISSIDANDTIVICGGDGTLNRFANDTDGIDISNEILYYPAGTGNDFLRDVEAPSDKPISVGKYLKDLPVVEVNGKKYKFLNNVGFGIDGYCCEVGDELKKTSDKPVNYTAIAIKGLLFNYKPTNAVICVDGKEYSYRKVWLAPTMKGRFYGGGMMAAPEQDRTAADGKLSIMLFHGKGRLATLIAFPSIFKGEHVQKKNIVALHTGYDISVKFDAPAAIQIDGETITGITEYHAYAKAEAPTEAQAQAACV